jgi:hypothetical protein
MYKITPHSIKQAKRLGVDIKPSNEKNKKIDIYKDGRKLYAIGDIRYNDYGNYLLLGDTTLANKRRYLYHKRHGNPPKGTRSWWAKELLW